MKTINIAKIKIGDNNIKAIKATNKSNNLFMLQSFLNCMKNITNKTNRIYTQQPENIAT